MYSEALRVYETIKVKQNHLPALVPGECEVKVHYCDAQALEQELQAFNSKQGWLCYQSGLSVMQCYGKPLTSTDENMGQLLFGELVDGETSLHIRQNGDGRWRLFTIREAAIPSAGLMQTIKYLAATSAVEGLNIKYLQYQRFFEHNTDQGYKQKISRFVGFSGEQS